MVEKTGDRSGAIGARAMDAVHDQVIAGAVFAERMTEAQAAEAAAKLREVMQQSLAPPVGMTRGQWSEAFHDLQRQAQAIPVVRIPPPEPPPALIDIPAEPPTEGNPFVLVRRDQLQAVLRHTYLRLGHSPDRALALARRHLDTLIIAYPREE